MEKRDIIRLLPSGVVATAMLLGALVLSMAV